MPEKFVITDEEQSFEQGNNNITRIEGERVFKISKRLGLERTFVDQAEQWNEYYKGTDYATACVIDNSPKELSLPFISGRYPTDLERLSCLKEMDKKGFIMGDCRDNRNFIVHDNKVYPIDFGLIYPVEHQNSYFHEKAFLNEIERLTESVKPQCSNLTEIDSLTESVKPQCSETIKLIKKSIDDLRQYKTDHLTSTDKLTRMKAQKINAFIHDTEKRIANFNNGQLDAFSDYVEKNKASIAVLNQNPVTGSIWKSILLVLCTGIIPALAVGCVQAMATGGNSFLFFNKQTQSGRLASQVQDEVTQNLVL